MVAGLHLHPLPLLTPGMSCVSPILDPRSRLLLLT